jgi:hypothetical protein
MSSRIIAVTAQDIAAALHGNARFCPIAIALHRQGYTEPTVTRRGVILRNGVHLDLPESAISRVRAWDDGATIAPFSFEM